MKLIAHTEAISSFVLNKIKSYNLLRQKKVKLVSGFR